jgi:hypothetical protein
MRINAIRINQERNRNRLLKEGILLENVIDTGRSLPNKIVK